MIRQVRTGLSLVLAFVLAVVAFTYFLGGSLWTSRSASSRQEASSRMTDSEMDTHVVTSETGTNTGSGTNSGTHDETPIFPDYIHTHSLSHQHRSVPVSPKLVIHVQSGDCLWSIAKSHGTTVAALEADNHLTTDLLQIGQALRIPKKLVMTSGSSTTSQSSLIYTVAQGDSLWGISVAYGVPIDKLRADNGLSMNSNLYAGQKLTIHARQATYHPTEASKKLISNAPKSLIPVYQASGKRYGIPWTVLAAIHKEETDFDTKGFDVSFAGAIGPMQFMPETFRIYAVPAPGHKYPNIHNVQDAIYTAAHMLKEKGFNRDPYHAIYDYNHSVSYVSDIFHMSAV
ncbi:LysM peptidoglycan-binding domain-containing protein [Alicyclobacillus dauci]|uniref:LysM peptidoglycan-binding domain-containing protein n=1 Tax=Alicyclobacillus dauci TaxID=1475485 RepID=A0ABY6YYF2_9BACL|nr:LysM peptidoglycan-binding domain-containing protein [Alicyclobacillus dauci]WAH35114.1 LysM peptidoglycan-binding domain-containing protein [Alicyclobacillus dauci]